MIELAPQMIYEKISKI